MPQETSMFLEVNTLFTSSLMTTWSYWKDIELSKNATVAHAEAEMHSYEVR